MVEGCIILAPNQPGQEPGSVRALSRSFKWVVQENLTDCWVHSWAVLDSAIRKQRPWATEMVGAHDADYNPDTEFAEPKGELIPVAELRAEALGEVLPRTGVPESKSDRSDASDSPKPTGRASGMSLLFNIKPIAVLLLAAALAIIAAILWPSKG